MSLHEQVELNMLVYDENIEGHGRVKNNTKFFAGMINFVGGIAIAMEPLYEYTEYGSPGVLRTTLQVLGGVAALAVGFNALLHTERYLSEEQLIEYYYPSFPFEEAGQTEVNKV